MKRAFLVAAPAALLALLAVRADAVVTSTWTVDTYQAFDDGDATNAFITSLGEVKPGWETKRTALEGDGVWSSLRLSDGTILVGTDAGGALYKVSGDSVKKLATVKDAIAIVALVQASDGSVYAGTMPGAKLVKIDVGSGKTSDVVKLSDTETIWSLTTSGDAVYAGTGPNGKLFEIKKGAAKDVFDTEDKRITAMTTTSDGAVWFGTSDRALVFRYDPKDGTTRAMGDFAGNEVTAIAATGGGVIVAANELTDNPTPGTHSEGQVEDADNPDAPKGEPAKMPDIGSQPGADKDTPATTDLGRKGAHKGKGALFRIGDDGRLEQLAALTETYYTSIAVDPQGAVYAGAADKGRVYLVDTDDSVATAFDVDERAVSQLLWDGKKLVFTTDDSAAIYRATGKASSAKYVSEVYDAHAPSKFGKITWQGAGKLSIETRSGNTAKPGPGWSDWKEPTGAGKMGGGTSGGKIANPTGRYLQFRVAFKADDASLRRVVAFYVPQNQASEVSEVGVDLSKDTNPTLKDATARARNPVVHVHWKVDNPDNDDTTYTVSVRRDSDATWTQLVGPKSPLTTPSYDWNTEAYPDGWYRAQVTSSDAAANSPDRTLTSTAISPLFSIDNTRPDLADLKVTYPKASVKATDALNVIDDAAFQIDDGAWQLATTSDGIFDDLSESIVAQMPQDLAKGTHSVSIRVADAAGNVASTTATFVVK